MKRIGGWIEAVLLAAVMGAWVGAEAQAAPTAYNQSLSVATEDVRISLSYLSANSSGSSYKYTIMSLPTHGTLEYKDSAGAWRAYVAGTAVTYENNGSRPYFTASSGYLGSDSFTWKVTDAQGGDSNVATFSLSIVNNTAPTAQNSSLTTAEGKSRVGCSLKYSDPDGAQPFTFALATAPGHGTLEWYDQSVNPAVWRTVAVGSWINANYWYYTPAAGYTGADPFTWRMSDGITNSNVGTVSVTVTANTVPVAYDQKRVTLKNQQRRISAWYSDPDGQTMTTAVVTPPSHGMVTNQSSSFTYTPNANYLGTDSFTWRIGDGITNSGVATCRILVREVNSRAGMLVLLVVRSTLLPEITNEVSRLKADLENEGYTAKIVSFTGTSSTDVINTLKSEHSAVGQFVAGAILIGNIPAHPNGADSFYWGLEHVSGSNCDSMGQSLWVSRIWASGFSGGEVKRIKWALDANHAYRTGASRLPYTTYCYDAAGSNERVPSLALDIYAAPAEVVVPDTALTQGGEIMDEETHNDGWVGSNAASGHPSQVRFGLFTSCSSGRLGGPVNENLMRYGGGNLLSVGAYTTTYETAYGLFINADYIGIGTKADFRARLAAGDTWGDASVAMFVWEAMVVTGMWYGDMSLPVKAAPSNAVPVIASLTADKASGSAPLTVTLTAAARDPDGTVASYEWFINGFGGGYDGPMYVGSSSNQTHTFATAHRYPAEVQVMDNWKARAWASKEIVVGPELGQPFRARCGKNFGYYAAGWDYTDSKTNVWLHDQGFVGGTWGYSGGNEGYVNAAVADSDDDALYQYFRTGSTFTYNVPVTNGGYTLRLGFAEMQQTAAGQRLMDVEVQGTIRVVGLDVLAAAGAKTALVVPVNVSVTNGMLSFTISKSSGSPNDAILNCFEIVPGMGPNQPPVARDQRVGVLKDTARPISLGAFDPEGSAVTYTVGSPAHGTLSGTGPDVVYTPVSGYLGADSFTFRVNDGALDSNIATVNVMVAEKIPGLAYEYYHGSWASGGYLPDFDSLTPVSSGVVSTFSLAPRVKDTDFAFRYRGMIEIATNGSYTFYTSSDEGSKLCVDGIEIVNNDGPHGIVEQSGTMNLAAGFHDIVATFCQGGGGWGLTVSWAGPGITKQEIPSNVLFWGAAAGTGDLNANGMPDAWEVQYFGSTNAVNGGAQDDWDHDGMNNLAEYKAGTIPTNGLSVLKIGECRWGGGSDFVIVWSSVAGKYYAIRGTTNLLLGFPALVTNHIPAVPPANCHTVAVDQAVQRFYRVVVE